MYMHNIKTAVVLLVLGVGVCSFISCKDKPVDDAAVVVIDYLTTTDEKKLMNFLDAESKNRIKKLKEKAGDVYPFIWVHHDAGSQWEVIAITKTDKKSTVTVQCTGHTKQNALGITLEYDVVKENNQWRINVSNALPGL